MAGEQVDEKLMKVAGEPSATDSGAEADDMRKLGLALLDESAHGITLGEADSKERWNAYAGVPVKLSVLIPLPQLSLRQLLALEPGMMLVSEWQLSQDVPLLVGDVFLANVSCEAAGERLGVRINGFDQPANGF